MSNLKLRALASACALLGAAGAAHAQTTIFTGTTGTIYGAGSSLLAPYWAQAAHCFDSVNSYPSTTNEGAFYVKGSPDVLTATAPVSCTSAHSGVYGVNDDSTGSGSGIGAVYAHTYSGSAQQSAFAGFLGSSSTSTPLVPLYSLVNYAISDNGLAASDVSVYNSGGTEQGVSFGASGTYPTPLPLYGPLDQFPVTIDPVALAYNPMYASSNGHTYPLQVNASIKDTNGGLRLNQQAYCAIFNGVVTDWGDASLTTLNGGQSLIDTADGDSTSNSHPIHLVGRSDSSGTTSIFTRHLASVCAKSADYTGTNNYTTGATTVTAASNTATAALYTLVANSSGVATQIHSAAGSIGYLGPDYALPYVTNTLNNTYNLNVAALYNIASAKYLEPTPAEATAAYAVAGSPPSGAAALVQTNWVESPAPSNPLADPTHTKNAYPIVGTTNYLGYACYAQSSTLNTVLAFLQFGNTTTAQTVVNNAGLALLPSNWQTAIGDYFFVPTDSTAAGDNLFFALAKTGVTPETSTYTNANCKVSTVVGG